MLNILFFQLAIVPGLPGVSGHLVPKLVDKGREQKLGKRL